MDPIKCPKIHLSFFSGCIVNIAFALLLLGELVIWIKVGMKPTILSKFTLKDVMIETMRHVFKALFPFRF